MKKLILCLSILFINTQPIKAAEWKALDDDWYLLNDNGSISKGIVKLDDHYEWFDQQGRWQRTLQYPLLLSGYKTLDHLAADILDSIYDSTRSERDQLMAIQTWFMEHAFYKPHTTDQTRWGDYETDNETIGIQRRLWEAAPILLDHYGICFNYAACFYWLTRSLGYDSMIITGTWRGQPHSWNAIYLNQWLFFDVTMADTFNDPNTYFMMNTLPDDYQADDFAHSLRLHEWQSYTDLEKETTVIRNKEELIDMLERQSNIDIIDVFYAGEPFCMDMSAMLVNAENISYLSAVPKASDAAIMLKGQRIQLRLTYKNQLLDQWLMKNQQTFCLTN